MQECLSHPMSGGSAPQALERAGLCPGMISRLSDLSRVLCRGEMRQARNLLEALRLELLRQVSDPGLPPVCLDIADLDRLNLDLIDELLDEGEVSMYYRGENCSARIRSTRLPGVWRVRYFGPEGELSRDTLELAAVPRLCRRHVFNHARAWVELRRESIPEGVVDAPRLLSEINDKLAGYRPGCESHVIPLFGLASTEQDRSFLAERLGRGPLDIRLEGERNCRITSTGIENTWRVEAFDTQGTQVLDRLEIGDVPALVVFPWKDIEEGVRLIDRILEED